MSIRILTALFALVTISASAQTPSAGTPQGGADPTPPNAPDQRPAFAGQTRAPVRVSNVAFDVVTVAEGLQTPWGMAFLPDGRILVTEKPAGRLRIVGTDGKLSEAGCGTAGGRRSRSGRAARCRARPELRHQSSDLLELRRAARRRARTTPPSRAARLVEDGTPRVEDVQVIFHQAPSLNSTLHFGGRLVFGRDGTLFVTLGERSITEGRMQAQRMDGLLGKIVRINPDGSIPKDNPFVGKEGVRPEIWSLGHRNVQAATLQSRDRRAVGSRARHARRRRDQHLAQGQGLRLADDRLRHRVSGRPDHRRHHGEGRAWSSRSTTGIRSSRRAA